MFLSNADCSDPPEGDDTDINITNIFEGRMMSRSVVTYTCKNGLVINPKKHNNYTCDKNGKWEHNEAPTCVIGTSCFYF